MFSTKILIPFLCFVFSLCFITSAKYNYFKEGSDDIGKGLHLFHNIFVFSFIVYIISLCFKGGILVALSYLGIGIASFLIGAMLFSYIMRNIAFGGCLSPLACIGSAIWMFYELFRF